MKKRLLTLTLALLLLSSGQAIASMTRPLTPPKQLTMNQDYPAMDATGTPDTTGQDAALPAEDWAPIPAVLNQRMATRSGPGTSYTEELGTLPVGTEITLFRQELGGVPWGLVEFERHGKLYRAYTGMKRIDTDRDVPTAGGNAAYAIVNDETTPLYGPGPRYAVHTHRLPAGTAVLVYGEDQGYALIDYIYPENPAQRMRAWVPASLLTRFAPGDFVR